MSQRVWVYLERDGEGISDASLQAAASAVTWAGEMGLAAEGVGIGGEEGAFHGLPEGLGRVHHVTGEGLGEYTAQGFGAALEGLLREETPALLILPSSTQGEDLGSWLGASTGAGALLGAREIRHEGGHLVGTRWEFEGRVAVDYEMAGSPAIVTVEEGGTSPAVGPGSGVEIVAHQIPSLSGDPGVRVLKTEVAPRAVDLRQARVIVAVGAGLGSKDAFEQASALARLLGGEVGATRAAVDAGWVAHERQIGQTGVKVRPDLYVACGISGAAQHRVGMLDSGIIVSVNIDPQAPIFRVSHYCVVGDVKKVLPKVMEMLKG